MPFSDTDRGLFNVVLVTEPYGTGELHQYAKVVNPVPVTWQMACRRVEGILRMISDTGGGGMNAVDAYIEQAAIPRPWSPETLAAFNRVCGYEEQPGREGVHVELYQRAADRLAGRAA